MGDVQDAARSFLEDRDENVRTGARAVLRELEEDQRRSKRILNDPDASPVAKAVAFLGQPENPVGFSKISTPLTKVGRGGVPVTKLIGGNKIRAAGKAVKNPARSSKEAATKARDSTRKTTQSVKKKARRIKQQSKTNKGRKQLAAGAVRGAGRGAATTGKAAIRRGAKSKALPAGATVVIADEAGIDPNNEVVKKGSALVKGAVAAPINSPGQYVATTGRGLLGMGAAFGLGAYALGNTGVRAARAAAGEVGTPYVGADYSPGEIAEPTTDLVKQEVAGAKQLGKKLLSGNEKVVEKTFTEDLGGAPFIPLPWLFRKTRNSNWYRDVRGALRDRAAEGIRKERADRAEADAAGNDKMPEADRKGRDKPRKRPRSAITDPLNPDEEYLLSNAPIVRSIGGRPIARKISRRNVRRGVSRTADIESQIAAKETVFDDKDVQADLMGISIGPKKGRNKWLGEAERAVFVVANRGIPFDRERGLDWIAEIERSKDPDTSEVGGVRESRVLDWIKGNSEVLNDPAFQRAVTRMGGILDSTTFSQRAKFLPVAKVAGIKTPEERLADGVVVGDRVIKETSTKPTYWDGKEADLRKLRNEARQAEDEGNVEEALTKRAEATELSRRIRDFRVAYKKALKDFVSETEGFIAERGLRTPARLTDDRKPRMGAVDKFGNAALGRKRRNSRATQKSDGTLLARDTADRSREGVWTDSVLGPRLQRAFHALTKGVVAEFGYKITVPGRGGKPRKVLEATTREHQAALERGELPEDVILIDRQYYRAATRDNNTGTVSFGDFLRAVSDIEGPLDERRFGLERIFKDGGEDDGAPPVITPDDLRLIGKDDRSALPGKKYIAVDREAMLELVGQIEGVQGGLSRFAAKLNRGTSNVILGWNPSFIGAQQLAEGGPAITAAATANPASIGRMAKAAPNRTRGTNRQRAQREAMYGIAGGTFQFRQPSRGAVIDRVDQLTEPRLTKSSKTLGLLKDAFRGRAVNQAVLRTGASYRRLAGLAELDRRTQRTIGSLGGLVTRFNSLEKKFKGKSLAEVEDYFAANPKLRAEVRGYLDDVMGNFSTLTRLEARFAPGIAFYPYLRYSLKWGFYSFPQRHPVRASILYFLGQVNAEELEKLVRNGTITDWIDNSFPIASKDGARYPLPSGGRFAPVGSGVFQSLPVIGEGDPDKALGVINPGLGAIINAAYGRDSFDGEKIAEGWWDRVLLGASAFLAMAAPLRAIDEGTDLKPISSFKPRRSGEETVIGGESDIADQFDRDDPNRILRQILPFGPLYGQSAKDYRKSNRRARRLDRGEYSTTNPFGGSNPFGSTDPFSD